MHNLPFLQRLQPLKAAKMLHCNKSALEQKQIKTAEKLQFFVKFFTLCAGVCAKTSRI
jgi:hypothetical protein